MSIWKRAGALMLTALVCLVPLSGCSREPAGISLSVCVGGEPVTLDPIYAEETGDQTILVHLYENLMRVVSDGSGKTSVTNGIAKSVSQDTNYDGSVTYTFKLRSARWSDGRTVRASDYSRETEYGSAVDGTIRLADRSYRVTAYLKDAEEVEPGDLLSGSFRIQVTFDAGQEPSSYYQGKGIFLLVFCS